jgi:hypothetical protein
MAIQINAYNKFAKLVHYAHWTAAPLQIGGFASQNFTTNLQNHVSRLQRR